MPWTAKDSTKHISGLKSAKQKRQWAHIADNVLSKTGDEARAIREANGVLARAIGRRTKNGNKG